MPYPNSPFSGDFDARILLKLGDDDDSTVTAIQNEELLEILEWLCGAPKITSYRVNTLKSEAGDVRKYVEAHVRQVLENDSITVKEHPEVRDTIVICNWGVNLGELKIYEKEIIVDATCAAAVLRGAHIYAPGVMAMMTGTQIGDHVSIYADIAKKCKKGFQKLYNLPKIFIGNGIVKMIRSQLFCENPTTVGIAVQITESISSCPPLGDDFLPRGVALLQNLPSIICVHVLDPQPGDVILDMCASPGNKTTHIAALMRNQGKLIAIDKTPSKVEQLRRRCDDFGAKVEIFQADSTKILLTDPVKYNQGPQFSPNSFDKILLDAPCSALGKRPQLLNTTSVKVLRSYVPLQRKLFETAVGLLKQNGVLVYSTCTITLGENEGTVAWALKTFKSLELVESTPHLGGFGARGTELTEEQLRKLQRFGPNQKIDSVGFFIAKFIKKHSQ